MQQNIKLKRKGGKYSTVLFLIKMVFLLLTKLFFKLYPSLFKYQQFSCNFCTIFF